LPVNADTPIVSLLEGNTPLLKATKLSQELELNVFFKLEGLNPTGSFKDRGMTMAMSMAKATGAPAVICASTGNTSASTAAYSARASLNCYVIIPEGKIAFGKLAQALVHGAKVIAIDGNFDDALSIAKQITDKHNISLVNSINKYRLEGQKTASFEICDQLGGSPDYLFIPVGNAGNITAYWMGFKQYKELKRIDNLPKMVGYQAAGAAPIVIGHPIEHPETIASAIRIGNPARWQEAKEAASSSGGYIDMVDDEDILNAYKKIASSEGYFCEPASAASVAGLIKAVEEGKAEKGSTAVCVLTGHGLKDPDTAIKVTGNIVKTKATLEAVEKAIF